MKKITLPEMPKPTKEQREILKRFIAEEMLHIYGPVMVSIAYRR